MGACARVRVCSGDRGWLVVTNFISLQKRMIKIYNHGRTQGGGGGGGGGVDGFERPPSSKRGHLHHWILFFFVLIQIAIHVC